MIIESLNPSQLVLQVSVENADGTKKTSLSSADVRVYHLSGGAESEDLGSTAMAQVGSTNIWRYIWAPGSLAVDHYFAEYTLVDDDAATFVGVEDIDIRDLAVNTDLTKVLQIEQGRWKIVSNQMIFYDDDDVTPLLTFDLKNSAGNPTTTDVVERTPA
jgi:hypothetical protein